ncbi:MAG: isopeptide-forming domain-containing fimbrial protein [Ruminococcus sp.]|nr:isopeptide-forming domain-containing fimbrial protein [Ruminococcus sp.]
MKHSKKFTAMIAALALTACSIAPMFSFATGEDPAPKTVTITMQDPSADGNVANTKSTFTAFKILDASVSGTAYNYTVNAKYREVLQGALDIADQEDDDDNKKLDAAILTAMEALTNDTLRGVADTIYRAILSGKIAGDATATNGVFSDVAQGYYLIAETALGADDTEGTMSLVMVETMGEDSLEITTKKEGPSFQKKLKDINDSVANSETDWQDSADYDINDEVPFQLKATLPDDYDKYEHYTLVFHDDLNTNDGGEDVFDLVEDSFVVYADVNGNGVYDEGEEIDVEPVVESKTHDDFDCDFEVTIPDLKDESLADIGITKTTPIYVEYKAKLNENAALGKPGNWNDAYLEYSNNPYNTGEGDENPKSKTPVDTVVVFTYKTVVDKINPEGESLSGAEFKLEKYDAATDSWVEKALVTSDEGDSFSFTGLDDGDYRLEEVTAPAGYKKIDGYITFTVTAEHTENGDKANLALTSLTGDVTGGAINIQNLVDESKLEVDNDLSTLDADVINTSGSRLPSTGGIGTTIFYLGGGAMVAVAGVFLITKKRMGKQEN